MSGHDMPGEWLTIESRDYRVLQLPQEQVFAVYEAVSGRLLPDRYPTQSAALWAAVAFKEDPAARSRAAAAADRAFAASRAP